MDGLSLMSFKRRLREVREEAGRLRTLQDRRTNDGFVCVVWMRKRKKEGQFVPERRAAAAAVVTTYRPLLLHYTATRSGINQPSSFQPLRKKSLTASDLPVTSPISPAPPTLTYFFHPFYPGFYRIVLNATVDNAKYCLPNFFSLLHSNSVL